MRAPKLNPRSTQAARRGDAPAFLSICHVLEFEPICREEALKRKKTGTSCSIGTGGLSREFMARDSAVSEHSIRRVLYIKAHDPERFEALKKQAASGRTCGLVYMKDRNP